MLISKDPPQDSIRVDSVKVEELKAPEVDSLKLELTEQQEMLEEIIEKKRK